VASGLVSIGWSGIEILVCEFQTENYVDISVRFFLHFSKLFLSLSLSSHLLTKLSLWKLVVLICELCSCNDLLASLYSTVFWRTRCQSSDAEFMFNESAALSFSKFLLN
jgi:hypothetical protein